MSAAASPLSSPRSLHNLDGLGSPVAIKVLTKAVLLVKRVCEQYNVAFRD